MAERAAKKPPVVKYYYSKSANHTLGGFIQEAYYTNGKRKNGDIPIKFNGHFVITDEPKKQKFIENHKSFGTADQKNKMIRELTEEEFNEMQTKHAKRFVVETATSR